MSAAEMREAAVRTAKRRAATHDDGSPAATLAELIALDIAALPLSDEEGMVKRVLGDWGFVEALIEHATHAHVDKDLELRRAVARAAIRAINGGEP